MHSWSAANQLCLLNIKIISSISLKFKFFYKQRWSAEIKVDFAYQLCINFIVSITNLYMIVWVDS